MRVERFGGDKVRFFLTNDDLLDRGIEKDDMWRDVPKVHELFNDMMEHAYQELGFEVVGPLAVEVFPLPAQGMVIVVSQSTKRDDELVDTDMYELEVTMEERDNVVFRFSDFEHLVSLAVRMYPIMSEGGSVFCFKDQYYLVFEESQIEKDIESIVALLLEYGEPSTMTDAYLEEYGKTIWKDDAIQQMIKYFK